MPKYFCDYCDTHLTHDSPSVRKTHNSGRKHKENVRMYYQQWMEEQAQKLVDATAKAFKEGKIPANPIVGMMRPPMIPPGAMVPGSVPVSYTHLDVYKRQDIHSSIIIVFFF
ncbi:U1 small nuclear ribonucleoprotein C [Trichinella pseudospiralis]|uniref:U1 small nuclear ribonucleoprotein C n=1 Tax=Trichinella pseudospiralis TaxID=6337 RepID=A0A0V0XUP0_TRIPS|nr:U1 small nuclear ribonucleoprotein C [Trichinella pseudospiralis]